MGTSDAYLGSGGPWNGIARDVEDLHEKPSDDAADSVVEQAFNQLIAEISYSPEAPAITELVDPSRTSLPGPRIRPAAKGTAGAAAGNAPLGGSTPRSGAGGRARARIATSGARALAAGTALRRADGAGLRSLGLNLAELSGLEVLDQVARILDVAAPASGLQADAELRHALAETLLALLEGEGSSRAAMETFVVCYAFEVLITETGARQRNGERAGALTNVDERRLRAALEAYAQQLDLSDDLVTEIDFRTAIETVLAQGGALIE